MAQARVLEDIKTVGEFYTDVVGLPPAPASNTITDKITPTTTTGIQGVTTDNFVQLASAELEKQGLNRPRLSSAELAKAAGIVREFRLAAGLTAFTGSQAEIASKLDNLNNLELKDLIVGGETFVTGVGNEIRTVVKSNTIGLILGVGISLLAFNALK